MRSDLPDPASVQTLLLDAGGVIVRPDFGRVAAVLEARGVAADPGVLKGAEAQVKKALDRPPEKGAATDEERGWSYFNLLLRHAGIERSAATDAALLELKTWHDLHCLWDQVPSGADEALRRLRAAGMPMSVVSNSNGTVRLVLARLGLLDLFDTVIDSAEEGMEKPDPGIFRLALERTGATAAGALFVGDIYCVDVVGARAAGIRPVLLDEAGLYPDVDCPTVRSLADLAEHLAPGRRRDGDFLLDSGTTR